MAGKSRSCANCLQVQQRLSEHATEQAFTTVCEAGMSDTAIPVRLGEKLVGFLQTGQVFRKEPSAAQFDRTAKMISEWGVEADIEKLRDAYFDTRVMSPKAIRLVGAPAEHLRRAPLDGEQSGGRPAADRRTAGHYTSQAVHSRASG